MSFKFRLCLIVLALSVGSAWGQTQNDPHVGYLYPSGAQQGTVVLINAGGQFLRGATDVYVSGDGVHAKVVKYNKPLRNLKKEQRELIQQRMKEVREKRLAELGIEVPKSTRKLKGKKGNKGNKGKGKAQSTKKKQPAKNDKTKKTGTDKSVEVTMPDHPLLYALDNKSLRELEHVRRVVFASRRKSQQNRQLAESVMIEITVDPAAVPGDRELRIATAKGLTNPMVFQVGLFPEITELEPNNQKAIADLPNAPEVPTIELPVLLNGQILPGDVDRFCFKAAKGQKLVIDAHARSLLPYLADAVPGWFQATVALFDAKGKELAYADDYRFNPDPVLFYQIPADGEYELEVRDSIYRGREDFVYRVAVGEQPFITNVFPLGVRQGEKTVASISGWNLPVDQLVLNASDQQSGIHQYYKGRSFSNAVSYAVDDLPQCNESESNNTLKRAQSISLPMIVNGSIASPADVDVFKLQGKKDEEIVSTLR